MAQYERRISGDFDEVLRLCERAIMDGSATASYEGGSDYAHGSVRAAVRVYERYSIFGSNRVSLNLTLIGEGNDLFLSAITAGGSQAMFYKVNTVGEENFLDTLTEVVERQIRG